MTNCLVQAVAAEAILVRAGRPCQLRIGVAKAPAAQLGARAWLESDGEVLIGRFELGRYAPLAPDPPAPTRTAP